VVVGQSNDEEDLVLGRYRLLSLIATGGMGEVHRAEDVRLGRVVALKRLPASSLAHRDSRRRMISEARATARLRHPHVVTVYDAYDDDGNITLAMELVEGPSLRDRITEGPLSVDAVLRLIAEVASALDAAHAIDLVHRDVKPENVLFGRDGAAVLCDFGIVKELAPGDGGEAPSARTTGGRAFETDVDAVPGTPPYVSPERIRTGRTTPAADQFSLAVVAFEALTGRLPWGGGAPLEGHQIFAAVLLDPFPPVSELRPNAVPGEVDLVLARASAKEPADRYPSCGAFAEALQAAARAQAPEAALQETTPSGVRALETPTHWPSSVPRPPPPSPPGTATDPGGAADAPSPPPRRRRWWTVRMAAGAAVAAIAALLLSQVDLPVGPLAPVTACPVFEATDAAGRPATTLGAAAANVACQRLAIRLGGRPETTRVPAELISWDDAPGGDGGVLRDPYDRPGLLTESTSAAEAYRFVLEGRVVLGDDAVFRVVLRPRRGEGSTMSFGQGRGQDVALPVAVEEALRALDRQGHLAQVSQLDPKVQDFGGWNDIEAALFGEQLDAALRSGFHAPGLCEEARRRGGARLGPALLAIQPFCEMWRVRGGFPATGAWKEPSLPTEPPELRLVWQARLDACDASCREALEAHRRSVPPGYVRAKVALAQASAETDPERGIALAEEAVRTAPRLEEGHQRRNEHAQRPSVSAIESYLRWFPDRPNAWALASMAAGAGEAERAPEGGWALERAYQLGWMNAFNGLAWADHLLARGELDRVSTVAHRYLTGAPWLALAGSYLTARVDLRQGRFLPPLEELGRRLRGLDRFGYGEQMGDLEAAELYRRLLVEVLEAPDHPDFIALVDHLLLGGEPHLRRSAPYFEGPLLSLCVARGPEVAEGCLDRLEALELASSLYPDVVLCRAAIRRWVSGDLEGAGKTWWRMSLSDLGGAYTSCAPPLGLLDRVAEAQKDPASREDWFDRAHTLDQRRDGGRDFHGIDPVLPRMAERAHRRAALAAAEGREETAAAHCREAVALADRVIDAWSPTALDLRVPAVPRLRELTRDCRRDSTVRPAGP
jgi:serine/threonine protein kinase